MRKNRFLSLLLATFLICGLLPAPAFAADETAIAKSMTLEQTEGSVTVRNARAKTVRLRAGARLYKGYSVTTGQGYAWIGLDDTKAVKLDWNTEVTLKKSGKKLEILLESGALFFNVQKPLEADESLTIRTSNMSTGIRGTSGIVETGPVKRTVSAPGEAPEEQTVMVTTVTILTGSVEVTTPDNRDPEQTETVIVSAGWQGTVTDVPQPEAPVETVLTPIGTEEILNEVPFVTVEVQRQPELQQQLEQAAGQDLTPVLEQSSRNLLRIQTADAAAETAAQQQIQSDLLQQKQENPGNDRNDQVFADSINYSGSDPAELPPLPSAPSSHTVTFYNEDGAPFASVTVEPGQTVAAPWLQPGPNGSWCTGPDNGEGYDFSAPVTGDLSLYWQPGPA